ncbi:MAG: NAD(P)-binding protein [Acidimicrobiales bacterium]|nr:NAD(P)-binding protein [Acidimicrobiales bacterium]
MTTSTDVVIVGAGIAGLSAARRLHRAGRSVRVFDKGRGVGGRMATRRIGGARFDHGAQFFTVRSDAFRSVVDQAIADGVVLEWCRGFSDDGDGYPRFRGANGMTDLAKWLGTGLDVVTAEKVTDLHDHPATAYVVTSPVPQTIELLAASRIRLDPDSASVLHALTYDPTMAVLVHLDGPSQIPTPGGRHDPDATFSFVADNHAKGISREPAVTLHINPELSRLRWDDADEQVIADMLEAARPHIGPARVLAAQLMRWRYATPLNPHPQPSLLVATDPVVVLGGDAFGGPKVEGAFRSGQAAADAVLERLGPPRHG